MRPVKCGRVFFAIDKQPWEWAERHRLHVKEISLEYNRLKKEILEKEFSRMNEMQKKAVFHINGPLLILAGAGSGKTTVLVNRIANMVKYGNSYESSDAHSVTEGDLSVLRSYLNGDDSLAEQVAAMLAERPVAPWKILAITFTNKAAGELKQRLSVMLGDKSADIWAATFHSTCARILRRDSDLLGFSRHFTVYDSDDSKRLMKECQKTLKLDDKMFPTRLLLSNISKAKDNLISPKEFLSQVGSDFRLRRIGEAYDLYQRRLKEADAMDFDDLLYYTVALFRESPEVLAYYQNKFRYILVDEYQDTNHAQYQFIQLLAKQHQNLCVVGDDDQSIYRFRGANIENILSFEKSFPDCAVIRLEQNYRSTQNILSAANAVIENNRERKGKTLWTNNPEGEKIQIHTSLSEMEEGKFIADTILQGVANGRRYSDFAILYRMNAQSNVIERSLVKSAIPYRIVGGFRFYERKEIRDMIAYLSVIANPADEMRLRRIINEPKRAIGEKTVASATEISGVLGVTLFEVLRHADEYEPLRRSAPKLMAFVQLIDSLSQLAQDESVTIHELYEQLLEKSGYLEALRALGEEGESRIENVNELASNLIKYEEENGEEASLSGFLEEVSLMTDIDNYDENADSVVLMTMHSAKGLEFPVVFIPGIEEGIFPSFQSIQTPGDIEEERRLAYVGITRAKEQLYLLNATSRMIYGSTNRNKLSRFAEEIPEELAERTVERSWKQMEPGDKIPASARENKAVTTNSARSIGTSAPKQAPGASGLAVGDPVLHKVFGQGMILSATRMGNDTLLEIAFEKVGTKKVFANYAKLKKLS